MIAVTGGHGSRGMVPVSHNVHRSVLTVITKDPLQIIGYRKLPAAITVVSKTQEPDTYRVTTSIIQRHQDSQFLFNTVAVMFKSCVTAPVTNTVGPVSTCGK